MTVSTSNGLPPFILTNCPAVANCGWLGNFDRAEPLVWVSGKFIDGVWTPNGPLTLTLSSPQRGLAFRIMGDEDGLFSGTLCAYGSGDTLLGCGPYSSHGAPFVGGINGRAAYVGVYDDIPEISKLVIDGSGTLYAHDFAIGEMFVAASRRMVPATVTVQPGATTATFPVNTDTVGTPTTVTL